MDIPQIGIETLPQKVIDDLLWAYGGITQVELETRITALNKTAESHIKASINNFNVLRVEEWKILKEPFIIWQLYSKLEQEQITKDKREDYYMLIDSINRKQSESSTPIDTETETKGIMVF